MARQSKATAATLEHQPTPALGDLDEHGNERLPDFGEPSRDERIANLDERSERLNGHTPEGVRPSERCVAMSPLHIRCEFHEEHDGLHSWTPEPVHNPVPGTEDDSPVSVCPKCGVEQEDHDGFGVLRCEACGYCNHASVNGDVCGLCGERVTFAGQPTLPGTPEPEQNEYSVPLESAFGGKNLVAAPGLKAIAERLITDDSSLEHLVGVEIRYFWRRRGGTQGGNPRYARIKRPGIYESYFSGGAVVYFVDLSADHVREHRFTERQIEACLYSQLCRSDVDPIVGPDFSGFIREFDRFGAWSADLRELHAHVAKLPLEQAIDDAQPEGDEDEDD